MLWIHLILNFVWYLSEFLSTNGTYSYFQIDSTNGEITLAKTLDTLLKFDAVQLIVIVSDNGQPSLSTTVMVGVCLILLKKHLLVN